jgi:hypothetical protein
VTPAAGGGTGTAPLVPGDAGRGPLTAPAVPAAALLALQACVADDGCREPLPDRRRRGAAVVRQALEDLAKLQLALLRGVDAGRAAMEDLAATAAALEDEGGEAGALGQAVALRIRIELARRAPADAVFDSKKN